MGLLVVSVYNINNHVFLLIVSVCWETRMLLDQNPHVVLNNHIGRDKDLQEEVSLCCETHRECSFIKCRTISPQCELGVYQTHNLCSDTTCWESWLSLEQNVQVLVNGRNARDKDPQEVVIPCRETHGERWFIHCPTRFSWYF